MPGRTSPVSPLSHRTLIKPAGLGLVGVSSAGILATGAAGAARRPRPQRPHSFR